MSERFKDFLVRENGISTEEAERISSHLGKFIDQEVPEIGAIRDMRRYFSQSYTLPEQTFREAKDSDNGDPNLTPIRWFSDKYADGVLADLVDTKVIQEHDPAFAQLFNRTKPQGLTLGKAIRGAKLEKHAACAKVLGVDFQTAQRYFEKPDNFGRPPKKSR